MTNQLELKPCQCGRMPKLERSDLSGGGLDSPRIRLFCDHTTKWYYEEKYRDGIGGYDDIRAEAMENAIAEWNASADPAAPVADDAVEALAFILAGPQCQDVDDRFAKQVIGELAQKGYTLRRETTAPDGVAKQPEAQSAPAMTEAELEEKVWNMLTLIVNNGRNQNAGK